MSVILAAAHSRSGRMMEALGLDEEELRMRAIICSSERDEITTRCAGCEQVDTCSDWLMDSSRPKNCAPDYCRNRELFGVLAC